MHKLQGNVERIAASEVLPCPDFRRPSNTFTHPTPFGHKCSKVRPFRSITHIHFQLVFSLLKVS